MIVWHLYQECEVKHSEIHPCGVPCLQSKSRAVVPVDTESTCLDPSTTAGILSRIREETFLSQGKMCALRMGISPVLRSKHPLPPLSSPSQTYI